LSDGHLQIGEEVEILPNGTQGRIRGLQTHKQKEDLALPGSRTAVNISGVTLEEIRRGDVVAHRGDYQPTRRMDVKFRLLKDASLALKHNTEVKLFVGAAEVLARVRTLGSEVINPGEPGWLQLEMKAPVVVMRGDHYILRRPSPGETMGGGTIIDPNPVGRHKRFTHGLIERLESLSAGAPTDVLIQSLTTLVAAPMREVILHSNLDEEAGKNAVEELINQGEIVILEPDKGNLEFDSDILVTTRGYWEQLSSTTLLIVEDYHTTYPLRRGMAKEELKSRLKIQSRLFSAEIRILILEGRLEENGPLVLSPDHKINFSAEQEQAVKSTLKRFTASPFSPPSVKDTIKDVGEDVFQAMVDLDLLVPVSPEVVFRREDYDRMVGEVKILLENNGTVSAAQVRDHFNTSRRYVLALLEHMDEVGITMREGDVRRLR
jgi:selenocysteine-specific elongation factor